jgi:FKBP-type peptidyl-prolyl cis-trans isomerase (trigger factor)
MAKTKTTPDKLSWGSQKTFTLDFSVPWSEVKKTYDHVLDHFVEKVKIEGFRKGKAPKAMVEKAVDKADVYGEVINHLLPVTYAAAIKKHNLKPAISPQVKIVSAQEEKDWQFQVTACEVPEVKLNNYQQIIKGALAKATIWTPDKGIPSKETDQTGKTTDLTETQKLNIVSQALLDESQVELPEIMIKAETDRVLSRLLDQVQKLGLTIEQYASSNQKSVEDLKKEYRKSAENSLRLELILQAIADDKKFTVADSEIDKMIAASGDEKVKKQLSTPGERAYIATVLKKRQVVDYLLGL